MNQQTEIKLRNGLDVVIRPIRSADAYELLALHKRSSSETLYYRYLRSYSPSYDALQGICQMSDSAGAALVAVAKMPWETVIGMAYYTIENGSGPATAEPAFHIEDRFQGLGLGQELYRALSKTAVSHNIRLFTAYVHPGNKAMEKVFAKGNYPVTSRLVYGTREVEIDLSLRKGIGEKRPLALAV